MLREVGELEVVSESEEVEELEGEDWEGDERGGDVGGDVGREGDAEEDRGTLAGVE